VRVQIAEYKKSLREARKMKSILDENIKNALDNKTKPSPQDGEYKKVIAGMISDLEFALEWLSSGRNPDARRGTDRNGVYLTDPVVLDVYPLRLFIN
jgi:positive control factor